MTFGFTSASAGDSVDELADAIYAARAIKRGAVSGRRVAAFVTARALLDEGPGSRPAPEETIALASWLSTGRIALDAEDDDDEEYEEVESGELRDRWSRVFVRRRR